MEQELKLDSLSQKILVSFQSDFPLESRPYKKIADDLSCLESEVHEKILELDQKNIISRIGPIFTTHKVGDSFLAAVKCPEEKIEEVSAIISSFLEVNHNYLREDVLNIWFVMTGKCRDDLLIAIKKMEELIHLKVHVFPMVKAYKLDTNLSKRLELYE